MPGAADWQNLPNSVTQAWDQSQQADDWALEQQQQNAQDWGDAQRAIPSPPTPSDDLTNPIGTGNGPAMPAPAAGAAPGSPPPGAASPPPAAPVAPAASTSPTPDATTPPTPGNGQFSPYDDTFRKYAGDLANDPEFIKIVAAGTLAESSWNTNSTSGDGGHSWGLFQMHDHGMGAGMGDARLDPDAASAVMVPRYADAYRKFTAQGLQGPALAAAVGHAAEMNADASGAGYAAAYKTLSNGNAPAVNASVPQNFLSSAGDFFSNVGSTAQNAVNTVTNLGKSDQPGPAIQGDYTSVLPGGTQNPVQAGGQAASSLLDTAGMSQQAIRQSGEDDRRAGELLLRKLHGDTLSPEDQQWFDNYTVQQSKAVGGVEGGGMDVNKRPLFGRNGVPGADTGRNPVPAPTQPGDLTTALAQTQIQVARQSGMPDEKIADLLRGQGISDDQIQTLLNPSGAATPPTVADAGDRAAQPAAPVTPSVTDEPPPPVQYDANGNVAGGAPPDSTPPTTSGTVPPDNQGPPLSTLTSQSAPLPAGTKVSDLPPAVQTAFKQWAAVVGPDSNAAQVAGKQAGRAFDQTGGAFDANGEPVADAAQATKLARNQTITQARDNLDNALIAAGLRNGPVQQIFQNGKMVTQRALDPVVQKLMDNVTTPSAVPNMPILGGLQRAQQEIKGVVFPLSMFHAYTEGLYSTFSRPSGARDFANAFFSSAPTAAAQDSPIWLRAAKAGVTHLTDLNAPDAQNVSSGLQGAAIRAGIGGVGGASSGYVGTKLAGGDDEQARQNALIAGLAGATGAAAAKPLISDNLWRAVQYSKVKTFETLVNSGVDDQVAADAVNRTFGGLNYAQMARNRTFQDLLTLGVQAPDWGESTVRSVDSALFGGSNAGAGFSRDVIARTLIGTALATGILNMVFHGSPVADDPAHIGQVQLPSGTADKPVYIGIGPGNLQPVIDLATKLAADPSKALVNQTSPRTKYPGDIPNFILSREAAVPAAIGSALSGAAFGGRKAPLPLEIAANAAPISVGNAVQMHANNMSPATIAFLTAIGANPRYGNAGSAPPQQPVMPQPSTGGRRNPWAP